MKALRSAGAAAALLCVLAGPAPAAPFTPAGDDEVVERLPLAADPALRAVESLRRQLASRPADAALRLDIAERYFALAMAQGDSRYVGYALSTIAPLEATAAGDSRYWLVRGQLQQYSHDFDAALASLERASRIAPDAVEPVSWRAAIFMVQANYARAAAECELLERIAVPLLAQGCTAYVRGTTGRLVPAYELLSKAVAAAGNPSPGLALWAHTRLAEMAARLQRWDDAQRHYRVALDQGLVDQFLLASYADFLLQRQRPQEAIQLLAGWERSDVLLLRLALAGRATRDRRAADWAAQLRARMQEAVRAGDRLHEQEAARWALDLENDPVRALEFARSNYTLQREPRDAEILMRAALAARKPEAAQPAIAWWKDSGYEDAGMQALAARLGAVR